jgi:hypothetical protein
VPAIRPSFPIRIVFAFEVKTAMMVTARDGSGMLGKFGSGTSAGVTVTSSPLVSSIAADTSSMRARQLSVSGR